MTPSPDLIDELRAARPAAPDALRLRVRELTAAEPARPRLLALRLRSRRAWLVAVPAAAAVALASAGVLGLTRSGGPIAGRAALEHVTLEDTFGKLAPAATGSTASAAPDSAVAATPGRARQVSATLTAEVRDSRAVAKAAQDALELTRSLGGYVVSSSVNTGDDAGASLVVRVPVAKAQDAVVGFSAFGRIVSQQVNVQDLQESLDALEKSEATVRSQIARVRARLASQSLDSVTEATLRARLQTLRGELVRLRAQIAATGAEARMSTIQLAIVTQGAQGVVAPRSRIDRTIDEALNVLAWEGVVLLGLVIVLAPFAIAAVAVWLARRLYRRREADRLLAA